MKKVEPTFEFAYHMYHDGKGIIKFWKMPQYIIWGNNSFQHLATLPIGYLKLWQLEGAQMESYDVIFIDEAQDCTPGM